jgi:rSAM/selenodomain-associated transferase 2
MVSVIIPTYNEEGTIGRLVAYLFENADPVLLQEILVVDGGSTDGTVAEAERAGARLLRSPRKGRAAQMNAGARAAKGEVVYFLHADTFPPRFFCRDIRQAIGQDFFCGAYRLTFDYPHWFLRLNAWFTRFNLSFFRFGDQSLFVKKDLFERVEGFREDLVLLEDQEIIYRLRQASKFKIFRRSVVTSARKYLENGVFRTQMVFYLIYLFYQLGFSQQRLVSIYRNRLKEEKL